MTLIYGSNVCLSAFGGDVLKYVGESRREMPENLCLASEKVLHRRAAKPGAQTERGGQTFGEKGTRESEWGEKVSKTIKAEHLFDGNRACRTKIARRSAI
ncbi:hypothetical protein PoB_000682400 [Plakobranchus ocellatus]|uniref:Uncharacterized protein n=1 Tax=Plakobranchus ocellatus TaxID=259542 RepID=A0AAV3YE17_9GAST|nr:hypothetical protein PoB_000682400 [Plakobranchus ocellatus]